MTIRVTIEFANEAELIAYFNKAPVTTSDGKTLQPAKAPEAKNAAPAASSPSGAKPQAEAKPAPVQEKATESAGDAKPQAARTVGEAKALTMKIVSDKGRDAAVELLKKYGVPVAAKLPADKVDAFVAEAEALLA